MIYERVRERVDFDLNEFVIFVKSILTMIWARLVDPSGKAASVSAAYITDETLAQKLIGHAFWHEHMKEERNGLRERSPFSLTPDQKKRLDDLERAMRLAVGRETPEDQAVREKQLEEELKRLRGTT